MVLIVIFLAGWLPWYSLLDADLYLKVFFSPFLILKVVIFILPRTDYPRARLARLNTLCKIKSAVPGNELHNISPINSAFQKLQIWFFFPFVQMSILYVASLFMKVKMTLVIRKWRYIEQVRIHTVPFHLASTKIARREHRDWIYFTIYCLIWTLARH